MREQCEPQLLQTTVFMVKARTTATSSEILEAGALRGRKLRLKRVPVAALATTSCRNCGLPLHHHASCLHPHRHLPLFSDSRFAITGNIITAFAHALWRRTSRKSPTAIGVTTPKTPQPVVFGAIEQRTPHSRQRTHARNHSKTPVLRNCASKGNIYAAIS